MSNKNFLGEQAMYIYGDALDKQLEVGRRMLSLMYAGKGLSEAEREALDDTYDMRRVFWADMRDLYADNPIMQLHSEGPYGCEGCDYGGWEGEAPEWPCRTVNLIVSGDPDYAPIFGR